MNATEVEQVVRRIVREELASSDLVTETEAAALVKVSGATIRNWANKGLIHRHGRARSTRYSRKEVLSAKPPRDDKSADEIADEALRRLQGD